MLQKLRRHPVLASHQKNVVLMLYST
jgi:hypothetical protein